VVFLSVNSLVSSFVSCYHNWHYS